jgi:putative restriction endonuclease
MENKLPPLTVMVVQRSSGRPGTGFIAWDVDDLETAHQNVWNYNWSLTPNPYVGFGPDDTIGNLASRLVSGHSAVDVYAKVKVRGIAQEVFRAALRIAYDHKCAMCKVSFVNVLDAAHLISWENATPQQRLDVQNGILLCSSHHRLFDTGYLAVSQSLTIVYRDPEMKERTHSTADRALTVDLHGRHIHLPRSKEHWPSTTYLAKHHERLKWILS